MVFLANRCASELGLRGPTRRAVRTTGVGAWAVACKRLTPLGNVSQIQLAQGKFDFERRGVGESSLLGLRSIEGRTLRQVHVSIKYVG
jgi:hypothetical protein